MSERIMDDYARAKQMNGKKYFRYLSKDTNEVLDDLKNEDDIVEEIRVIKVKNGNEIVILDKDGEEIQVCPSYISEKKFTELLPAGYLSLSIVSGTTEDGISFNDVIVAVYNMEDVRNRISTPKIVCRQNINDVFYSQYQNNGVEYAGVSVSDLTCPANLTMEQLLQCNGVSYNYAIHFYLEDNLDLLLSYINTKKFDKELYTLYLDYAKADNVFVSKTTDYEKEYVSTKGHCSNLKTLLKDNNFEYDFDAAFGITKINIIIDEHLIIGKDNNNEYQTLDDGIISMMGYIFKKNFSNIIILEYDNDIDITEIKGRFYLIRDIDNKLYIMSYTEQGEYRETDLEVIAATEVMKQYTSVLNDKYKK